MSRRGLARVVPAVLVAALSALSLSALPALGVAPSGPPPARPGGSTAAAIPLQRFAVAPALRWVALSPGGDRIAFLGATPEGAWVGFLDPATGAVREVPLAVPVERVEWSADGAGLLLLDGPRIGYLAATAGRPGYLLRLPEGRSLEVLGADPRVPAAVLVREEMADGGQRWSRWTRLGGEEVLLERPVPIADVAFDGDGRPAFAELLEGDRRVLHRLGPGGQGREILGCDFRDACSLAGAAADGSRAYLVARPGRDLWGVWALDAAGGPSVPLHEDPRGLADLDEVLLDPAGGRPLLAVHHTEERRTYALDGDLAKDLEALEERLPGRDLAVDAVAGGRFLLVREEGARLHHPRYHAWDRERRTLDPILEGQRRRAPSIPPAALVERRHISYRASDGRTVHGFLSVPRGVEPSAAPLVVLVHGGPWNHERSGFRTVPQFLANRGYVVFEPNFRASTGYGFAYQRAGRGEFGDGRVHRDLVDGVDHLLAQGLGDPRRVAIAGHSFGGFSALNAAILSPERFRAAFATAPAIDLVRALRDQDPEELVDGAPLRAVMRELLVDLDDPAAVEELQRRSPEANLERTAIPVLILAGGRDETIRRADLDHYAAALAEAGKAVSYLVDPEAGHGLETPLQRRTLLVLLERFLAHHLAMPEPAPPDPLVRDHLGRTLRLAGPGLAGLPPAGSAVNGPGPPSAPPGR